MLANVLAAGLVVLLFRAACIGRASPPLGAPLRLLSGLWLALAVWIAGGLLHAWVPIWEILLVGVAAGAVLAALNAQGARGMAAWAVCDLFVFAALGWLSVIPVDGRVIAAAAVIFAAAGALFDVLTSRLSARLRVAGVWAPVILVAAMAASLRQADDFETRLGRQDPLFPLRQAFAAPLPGRRVDLNGGTVAWMLKNPHRATRGLAIIVHGNHPAGSWQPAALALQGALLRAGFDVLSVDHPGYGASAHPPASADWTAWDPRIGLREALAYARSLPSQKSAPITLVGHSMGVDTTLMWLDEGLPVKDVYLFSGAITRPPDSVQAESELWHAQRNMSCCIDPAVMSQIRSHFYADASVYAQALPADHPPLHFTRSGIEYADVAEDREILYPVLTAPKEVCDLPGVTHYMNTLSIRRSTVLDTAAIVEVAGLFDGTGIGPNGTTPCSPAPSKLPPPPPH